MLWPEEGIVNPCRAALPPELAGHDLVREAWHGIDPAQVWDGHVHVAGIGDSGSGIWVNPGMRSLLHPLQYAQRLFYLNAGCVHDAPGRVDASYIERLHDLVDGMQPGVKLLLFAFDRNFTAGGEPDLENTAFYIPDEYALQLARRHPRYFEWAASVHPYRADYVAALEYAREHGARAVKWLPAAMGIDPASPRCDPFYAALARLKLPLITHAGMEQAVHVGDRQGYGNPLLLRRALEHGVRVVVAHCASLGQDRDLDRGVNGPLVDSFTLFA
ncbi:MAG: amidohydrolase family protein, partial [Betaproteobacteria bacterium]|nr:amidohydrolase family protein [Betaproteobacteria bacterium]